jgi:hypothetical protein
VVPGNGAAPFHRPARKADLGKITVEQIVSADGYAAGDDGIGFFHPGSDFSGTEAERMRMMASVGAIVFGAATYRIFAGYWPMPTQRPNASPDRPAPCPSSWCPRPWKRRPGASIRRWK